MPTHPPKLNLPAQLLMMFCHEPWEGGFFESSAAVHNLPRAFDRWLEVLPDFRTRIRGARVIDFGCGKGFQAVAMAQHGAVSVLAVEILPGDLQATRELAAASPVADKIRIVERIPQGYTADLITSQNSFEHFIDAESILQELKQALAPHGQILITFAPPWFSPWGAHMAYFCGLPWCHLLFPEKVIIDLRSRYRDDGARTYEDAGLARMSLAKFERVVRNSGLRFVDFRYECVWGLDFLNNIWGLRELLVNRATAVLEMAEAHSPGV
jgi:SAM-dependent methyltransferase